jgi:hypothetical protein
MTTSIIISLQKWDGLTVSINRNYWAKHICLGWITIYIVPARGEDIVETVTRSMADIK